MTTPARENMARNGLIILVLPVLAYAGYATATPIRAQAYAAFVLSLIAWAVGPFVIGAVLRRRALGALALSLAFNLGMGAGQIVLQREWAARHSAGAPRPASLSSVELSLLAIAAAMSLLCLIPWLVGRAARNP